MKRAVIEKEFEHKGFKCCVILSFLGFRCGYVAIPKGHPYFNVHYDNIPVDCHGGLTYGNTKLYEHELNENEYWIGWDYGHYLDNKVDRDELLEAFKDDVETVLNINMAYRISEMFPTEGIPYSIDDVIRDCESVAEQLEALSRKIKGEEK